MRENHAFASPWDFEIGWFSARYLTGTEHATENAGNWGIGLLLRIESAGLATGLNRHLSFFWGSYPIFLFPGFERNLLPTDLCCMSDQALFLLVEDSESDAILIRRAFAKGNIINPLQ